MKAWLGSWLLVSSLVILPQGGIIAFVDSMLGVLLIFDWLYDWAGIKRG
jgi:hypothetical protein